MRRTEKAVTDPKAIEAIITAARVCRLGMCHNGDPYVVPLCFGYLEKAFYFAKALEATLVIRVDVDEMTAKRS
jgi:hypothetical protein